MKGGPFNEEAGGNLEGLRPPFFSSEVEDYLKAACFCVPSVPS